MQKQMEKVQDELKDMKFEASAGGGAVKVTVNGEQDILEVKINKDIVDPEDIEMLEDMVLVAVNDAIKQSKDEAKNKLAGVTGGLNIPGF
jgi:DNA-binding YbaB/EbfC family protein